MKTKILPIILCIVSGTMFLLSSCTENTPTQLANPMAGCEKFKSDPVNEQASYKGIYPGRTTKTEVENLLGKPLRINDIHGVSWEYDNLAVGFDASMVSELFVSGDSVTTLKDFILRYGCPDGVYALDINEHPYGEYSRLLFLYHRIGFNFTIDKIPAKLSDTAYAMTYFIPGTLEDYENLFLSFSIPNASKPMNWDDAVR